MLSFEEAQSLFREGKEQTKLKKKQKAEEIFTQVIKSCELCLSNDGISDHEDWKKIIALTYNNRGHLKYLQVEFPEAVEDYTKALTFDDTLTVAYYNRGLIHYRLGRFQLAAEDQRKALSLESDFESAKQCLEQCYQELSKKEKVS